MSAEKIDLTDPATGLVRVTRNVITAFGLELEGGWHKLPREARIVPDNSVHFEADFPDQIDPASGLRIHHPGFPANVGEINSPALPLHEMEKWLTQWYPQCVNKTCGMHVHISFPFALIYQRLMDESLTSTTLHYMGEWAKRNLPLDHHIWDRLEGKSKYCRPKFYADQQVLVTGKEYDHEAFGNRYTVWNYCYGRYRTMECRLLPMMPSPQLAVSAVRELSSIINAYLRATAKKTAQLEKLPPFEWVASDPVHKEEINECV